MNKSSARSFTLNERVTNERGAWATLRFDKFGGQHNTGVFYADAWAPNFPSDESHELSSNWDKVKVERSMRQWLAGR